MNEHCDQPNPPQENHYYVCIRSPGQNITRLRRRKPSTQYLSELAADVLHLEGLVERFSCRTVTVGGETEYHLWVETNPPPQSNRMQIAWLLAPEDIDRDELRNAPVDPVTAALARKTASYLPSVFGVEVAAVDLRPLGNSPPAMSRLLVTEQAGLTVDPSSTSSPLTDWLASLDETETPYLLQTDLERVDDSQYRCWMRAGVFDPETRLLTDEHLAELLDDGWQGDLANVYDLDHVTSNVQLLREVGWTARKLPSPYHNGSTYTLEWDPKGDIPYEHAKQLADVVRSPREEYQPCCQQTNPEAYEELYDQFDVDPTMTLDANGLSAVLGLIPGVSTPDQWTDHPGRGSPHIEPVEIIRTATGTSYEETLGKDTLQGSTVDDTTTTHEERR